MTKSNLSDQARSYSGTPLSLRTADATEPAQTLVEFLATDYPAKEPLIQGLVSRRDLITLGARRRHGKTTFLLQMALDLAAGEDDFLGYRIPEPRRTLLFALEDDPRELQDKIRQQLGDRDDHAASRMAIYTRDDFQRRNIPITVTKESFRQFIEGEAASHEPDLIIFDNLAHVIGADYGDAPRIHELARFLYVLARTSNAAIIVAAHPRKNSDDRPVHLDDDDDGTRFFEAIMGSSHFINSMGSLWGLERQEEHGRSVFLGGRQRDGGVSQRAYLELDDDKRFHVLSDVEANLPFLMNSDKRRAAWKLLPETFTYSEGFRLVQAAMKSKDGYGTFLSAGERLHLLTKKDGRYHKATTPGLKLASSRKWPDRAD